jgi:hypothetical protein
MLRLSGTPGSGSGTLAAWENLMSDARKPRPEWEFMVAVVAAIILAAAGGATIFSLMHRPVAAPHPPMAEPLAAPTLAAPEVSRPLRADTPVAAQQPTKPKEVKSPGESLIFRAGAFGLRPMCRRAWPGRSTMRERGNSLH